MGLWDYGIMELWDQGVGREVEKIYGRILLSVEPTIMGGGWEVEIRIKIKIKIKIKINI